MSKKFYRSYLVETNGDHYLVQGYESEDELEMVRCIDDLLECERDAVQVMLREEQKQEDR